MSERGPIGRDGATGAEGRAGTTGRDGGEGHAGARGDTGLQGVQGGVGTQGDQGVQGLQGIQGLRGPAGSRNAAAAFLILMTFAFFGFVAVERQADETIDSLRQGCQRLNVQRTILAGVLDDQIRQTDASLVGDNLRGLESFRDQIVEGNDGRKKRLAQLADTVKDHPVGGKPYSLDCTQAYP